MTRLDTARARRAFTLIELLVVMALIALLASIAIVITPGALSRDRAVAASSQLEGAFQRARALALRDGLPRGVRLIWNGSAQVTEYQYIESPPVFVPNPDATAGAFPYQVTAPPYVQFTYTVQPAPGTPTVPTGAVTTRQAQIVGLHNDHLALLQAQLGGPFAGSGGGGALLSLPLLGGWFTITGITGTSAFGTAADGQPTFTVNVTLRSYPDAQLGATTKWRTYHFGLYGQPRVLLGEPTLQLPQKTCVDLNLSSPVGAAGLDYDILFAPSGQLVTTPSTQGDGHVFLFIRDPGRPAPVVNNAASFQPAGEVLALGIKARSGAVGTNQVDWGPDPFIFARKTISGQ